MYWNNTLITVPPFSKLSNDNDPIIKSFHDGAHCMFWNPCYDFSNISTNERLDDLITWTNEKLAHNSMEEFFNDTRNHYNIANIVKFNLWIADMRKQGIIKPWLVYDMGDGTFIAGTGDSRIKCLELVPEITYTPAFITTLSARANLYSNLQRVENFKQFSILCNSAPEDEFLFRLTDRYAPHGLYWYEFNSEKTRAVTPSESTAVMMLKNYTNFYPEFRLSKDWLNTLVNWQLYTD